MANPLDNIAPPTQRVTVNSLLSPPEMKRLESFHSSTGSADALPLIHAYNPSYSLYNRDMSGSMKTNVTVLPANYPSPQSDLSDSMSQKEVHCLEKTGVVRDPELFVSRLKSMAPDMPLFPEDSVHSLAQHVPLFPVKSVRPVEQDAISQHMKSSEFANLKSKPAREDYELVVSLVSTVHESIRQNPRKWYNQERAFDQRYGKPSLIEKRPALKKLAPAPSGGIRKQKVALPRAAPRVARAPKRTPKAQVLDSFDHVAASVSPRPPRPATSRDDTDYNSLADLSPPIDTLPKGNNKVLKADWRGQALDLSNDPDRNLLHEAELHLASTLRLSCATYLCSKRRIFQARIEALRIGKEFRKTDAQQACKIDVNKASKLWQAYEKVGWFNPDYFKNYV
ncbi:hypothetical protein GQ43DRAFT_438938 [Delitschia confertaspora ATCC 74209]|uniref:SWIRM domain-containing protein n=1 Tax=Delitschia confertaspora ATCC 74209 TaxID=1513339 RepID=A0A9P4N0Z4_9PLEO|nr:hypothetical protein GQ43DRAFT_438938 [Delitschia confertaspora ATCC 74209]